MASSNMSCGRDRGCMKMASGVLSCRNSGPKTHPDKTGGQNGSKSNVEMCFMPAWKKTSCANFFSSSSVIPSIGGSSLFLMILINFKYLFCLSFSLSYSSLMSSGRGKNQMFSSSVSLGSLSSACCSVAFGTASPWMSSFDGCRGSSGAWKSSG